MALATTNDLITRCENRFGDPGHAIYTAANWLDYLNDAYRWVRSSMPWAPWKEKRTTSLVVTTTGTVALPTDAWRVNRVVDTTNELVLRPYESRIQASQDFPVATTGAPLYYRLFGQSIELFPTPTANVTLTVDYFGPESELSTAPVNPTFPQAHWGTLIEYALYLAYQDDDDTENAQGHLANATAALNDLEVELSIDRQEGNPVLVDDWYL